MKVLIADDNVTTRIVLRKNLREWGYKTVEAVDGRAAWEALTVADPPRIAILDWMMPELDGVSICKKLQEWDGPFIYTVLLTARNEKKDLVYALENGAYDFHSKPVDAEELRSCMQVGRRLVEANDEIQRYATQMKSLAEERAQQLMHADRLATLGALVAGIAHEINNPLGGISGWAEFLGRYLDVVEPVLQKGLEEDPDNQKLRQSVEGIPGAVSRIQGGAERINQIVSDLLSFSRKTAAAKDPVDVHRSIAQSLRLCHNIVKYKCTVERDFEEDLPPVWIASQKLEQILVNLITNAAHAMADQDAGTIRLVTRKKEQSVEISVEDSGPGIAEDKLESIWEPFFTTKVEGQGTGLGLSISRGIVQEYDGEIQAENRAKGGARFRLRFPISPAGESSQGLRP